MQNVVVESLIRRGSLKQKKSNQSIKKIQGTSMSHMENACAPDLHTLCNAAHTVCNKESPKVKIVSAYHAGACKGHGSRTLSSETTDFYKYVDEGKTRVLSFPEAGANRAVCQEIVFAATEHNGFMVNDTSVVVPVICVALGDNGGVSKGRVTLSMRPGQFTKLAPEKFEKLRIMDMLQCDQNTETSLHVLVCGFQELECCLFLPYRAHQVEEAYNVLVGLKDVLHSLDGNNETVWTTKIKFWVRDRSVTKTQCIVRKLLFAIMFGPHRSVFNDAVIRRAFAPKCVPKSNKRKEMSPSELHPPEPHDLPTTELTCTQEIEQHTLMQRGVLVFGSDGVVVKLSDTMTMTPSEFLDSVRMAVDLGTPLRNRVKMEHDDVAVDVAIEKVLRCADITNKETIVSLGMHARPCTQKALAQALALTEDPFHVDKLVIFWDGQKNTIAGMTPAYFVSWFQHMHT